MTQLALPVYFYGQGRMLSLITSGPRRRVVAMVLGNLFFDFAGKLFQAVKKMAHDDPEEYFADVYYSPCKTVSGQPFSFAPDTFVVTVHFMSPTKATSCSIERN